MIVRRMNEAQSKEDKQQDRRNLHQHHDVVGSCGLAYSANQHYRQQQHNQKRGNVESRMPARSIDILALQILQAQWQISRREPLWRQRHPDPVQQSNHMRGKAHAHAHVAERILQDQIPPNDPRNQLTERRVGIGVRRSRNGDHRRQLRIAETRQRAHNRHQHQRQRQCRTSPRPPSHRAAGVMQPANDQVEDRRTFPVRDLGRIATDRRTDHRKDAGTDHRANAESSQRNRPQRLLQRVLRQLRFRDQLVDRLGCKDLPGQRARSCLQKNWCGAFPTARC